MCYLFFSFSPHFFPLFLSWYHHHFCHGFCGWHTAIKEIVAAQERHPHHGLRTAFHHKTATPLIKRNRAQEKPPRNGIRTAFHHSHTVNKKESLIMVICDHQAKI